MKHLIRRLSRVADSSTSSSSSSYSLLRSDLRSTRTTTTTTTTCRAAESLKSKPAARRSGRAKSVPEGHVPVYVGDEMERFVVSAELLNHPIFIGLLNKSAQEYGYEQKGVLRIPCQVLAFERVMESLRLGIQSRDLEEILGSLSDEFS